MTYQWPRTAQPAINDFQSDIETVHGIVAVPTILEVICRVTGMGFAAVARVTETRWVACQVLDHIEFGMRPGDELKVETTLCHEVQQYRQPIVINHVAEEPAYRHHHTPALYGFQSYISMPIVLPNGRFFGTLCAIDPRPAQLKTPEVLGMFRLFAELIAVHVEAREKLVATETSLLNERHTAELREQFIAVLGHDLRNPLAAIDAGTRILQRRSRQPESQGTIQLMQNSVHRMKGLIDNLLDFARGRLGGGLSLERETKPLAPTLVQVIDELRASFPDRVIRTRLDLDRPVDCDHARIAQLCSNLLANAITHGAAGSPILVEASVTTTGFHVSVANAGAAIPDAAIERLFRPFHRGEVRPSLRGLGLGLYIASEIARAHGGTLAATSSAEETRFTLAVPELHSTPAEMKPGTNQAGSGQFAEGQIRPQIWISPRHNG